MTARQRCILILLLTFIAYSPAVSNGFIWDDDVMLTNNELMKAYDGLSRIWGSTELSDYFPLTSTSLWIEWRFWGMNPIGYNVTNILLHALSGILLWRLLLRLKIPGAWIAAVVFTVHPVCVASVDWIAERKNVLSLPFYFSSLLLYLRGEDEKTTRFYFIAMGLFLLALLSKTSVVMLPFVLLLFAWWRRGELTRHDILCSVPFFALSLILGLVTVWFQLHEVLAGEAAETDTFLSRVLDGSWGIWFYLGKILWPVNLSPIYPDWTAEPARIISYVPGMLWLMALVICWRFRRSWGRSPFFGLAYFTLSLFPVLGFFDMSFLIHSPVADHWQYIALPGIIALVVGVAANLYGQKRLTPALPQFPKASAALAIIILGILTYRQSSVYVTEENLWRDAIKKNPKAWVAYHNLGDTLAEQKRFSQAAEYYRMAVALKPSFAKAHNNLGNCLHILGNIDRAVDEFLDAIQSKPEMAEAHHNLGNTYYALHNYNDALRCELQAIRLKPNYAPAHFGAGNAAWQLGDLSSALQHYFDAVRYNPDHPDYHYNLGLVLAVQGNNEAAAKRFANALKLNPKHVLANHELQLLLTSTDEQR